MIMAMKSCMEYFQVKLNSRGSIKVSTATKIVAPNTALGSSAKYGVKNKLARAMPTAVSTPAIGVAAPASKFTTEREKPPVTEKPPDIAEATLAAPKPSNS